MYFEKHCLYILIRKKKKKTNTKHTRNKWTKSINKTKKKYNFFACVLRSDQVHRWRLLSKKKKQSSKKFPKKSTPSPKNKKINPVTETNSISFLNNRGSQIYPEVIYRYRKLAAFFEKHKWFHIPFRFFFYFQVYRHAFELTYKRRSKIRYWKIIDPVQVPKRTWPNNQTDTLRKCMNTVFTLQLWVK